ncbi:hypothetical protein F5Y01DRAFT_315967 [Xylaria sp. FL0043]|nr:hypothetical protein F5Y01DRAFT_315967 [Xylaria sp. FL0043]
MKFPSISLLAFAVTALAAPINNNEGGSAVRRTSPVPPIVDGGLDVGATQVKRTSPVPPIVDGGLDMAAAAIKRTSPVPPIVDGGLDM